MALLFDFNVLSKRLKQVRAKTRTNPSKAPKEYDQLLDSISQWARAGLKNTTKMVATNNKMSKATSIGPMTNRKLMKSGRATNWVTEGVALMPSNQLRTFFLKADGSINHQMLSKFNLTADDLKEFVNACPMASKGCRAVCLADAGMMSYSSSTAAQVRRHLTWVKAPNSFLITVAVGLTKRAWSLAKKGYCYAARMNVTSDIDWENHSIKVDQWLADYLNQYLPKSTKKIKAGTYANIMAMLPHIQFYDYTKVDPRIDHFMSGRLKSGKVFPKNYHLTWSMSESNRKKTLQVLLSGTTSVAVPFDTKRGQSLPETLTFVDTAKENMPHWTFKVIDADASDFRPMDPPGTIAGLRFKIPLSTMVGKTREQKMAAANKFVVGTGGDKHPAIALTKFRAHLVEQEAKPEVTAPKVTSKKKAA